MNRVNLFHSAYKLYICYSIFNGCCFKGMLSGKELTSLREMLRDKGFKEWGRGRLAAFLS